MTGIATGGQEFAPAVQWIRTNRREAEADDW